VLICFEWDILIIYFADCIRIIYCLKGEGQIWYYQLTPQIRFPINIQYILYVYLAPIRCYRLLKWDGTVYDHDLKVKVKIGITDGFLRCGLSIDVQYISYVYLAPIRCYIQATQMWWDYIWPWPLDQGQICHHQWMPQMWFPIDVQYILYVYLAPIRCYRLLIFDGTEYDLDH